METRSATDVARLQQNRQHFPESSLAGDNTPVHDVHLMLTDIASSSVTAFVVLTFLRL
ncbi:MAG TPA: hypothetical protein VH227_00460 [Candidatus Udaeobacter sp.]|nr:hypothetical protein [Candidatus Udaeobacter sp.]